MLDYYGIAGLDWSRVTFPPSAPCAHGLNGAPYCVQCLDPILETAAANQSEERHAADIAKLTAERDTARGELIDLQSQTPSVSTYAPPTEQVSSP